MIELSEEMMREGVIKEILDDGKKQDVEDTMVADQEEEDKIIMEISTGKKGNDLPDSEGEEREAPAPLRMGETITRSTDVISGVSRTMSKEVILDTENEIDSAKKGKKKRRRRQKLFTLDQIARM